jgi:DNA polymerase III epsilon subunit family exonuclease
MPLLSAERIVVVDTETTGMSPADGHALIEIAAVVLERGAIGETWSSLVRPARPIPPDASAVHGITDAMVADAPEPARVAAELRRRCGDHTLAFHNSPFDLPFVVALLKAGRAAPLTGPIVDTLGLARGLGGEGGNSLLSLRARYALPAEVPHRALGDALTTARLLVVLAERWEREKGTRSLMELAAASLDVLRPARREPIVRPWGVSAYA